jgi:hypothetical protein
MTPKVQVQFARRLSWPKRNILLDHVREGKMPMPYGHAESHRLAQVKWLLMKGLLQRVGGVTALTDDGRQVVVAVLDDYAEVLQRFPLPAAAVDRRRREELGVENPAAVPRGQTPHEGTHTGDNPTL